MTHKIFENTDLEIAENDEVKVYKSKEYNAIFNKVTGFMARWGKTKDEDPLVSPSNEILDLEISTRCNKNCKFCYKGNTSDGGTTMSLQTFKDILHKFPKTKAGIYFLQQIAFGIGSVSDCDTLFPILNYTRENNIIPNLTVNGKNISDQEITDLANVLGGIAVSHYNDKECFDTISRLAKAKEQDKATLKQITIHKLLAEETYDSCIGLLDKIEANKELRNNLNAVVFLTVKPRGPTNTYTPINDNLKLNRLFSLAQEKGIQFGCDSCSAPAVLKWIEATEQNEMMESIECCESCLTSFYVSVDGFAYPCSFMDGVGDWETGINMLEVEDFTDDVWNHPRILEWREGLVKSSQNCSNCSMKDSCRSCPVFDITSCRRC